MISEDINKQIDLAVKYYTKGNKQEQLKCFIISIIEKAKKL